MEDRGSITIFRQKFFVAVSKIFVGEPFNALINSGIEKFHAYERNITNFYGKFVVSQYGKTLLRNPSVFHKVSGVEKLMDKRGDRGYHDFRSQLFSLTNPKIFVGEPFSVSLISDMEKFYAYEGNFTIFYRIFLCLTVPKNFIGEPFHVSPIICYRKILWIRMEGGSITIFRLNFFVSQCQNFS